MSVKGTVVRVSNIKPLCTVLGFECNNCATLQVIKLIRSIRVLSANGSYRTLSNNC